MRRWWKKEHVVTWTVANISRQNVVDESENLVEKIGEKRKEREEERFYIELNL